MTRAIVSGTLHKAAEERTSKAGNPFATFTIRENVNGSTRWWRVVAFNESVIEALKELAVGEPIAVSGEFDCELYAPPGGESRLSWKITADSILSARRPKKAKILGKDDHDRLLPPPQDNPQPFDTKRLGRRA
jgi:single-stranded DNA-binding protein